MALVGVLLIMANVQSVDYQLVVAMEMNVEMEVLKDPVPIHH